MWSTILSDTEQAQLFKCCALPQNISTPP